MTRGRRILIGAAIVLFVILAIPAALFVLGFVRFYYVPSDAMEPTMRKDDHFVAWMRPPSPYRRGDIILVRTDRGDTWVKRLVGLPGDEIRMIDGVVYLNGQAVPQRLLEQGIRLSYGRGPARRLSEQFPGEASPHQIYDTGDSEVDDLPPQRVAPGHIFVIGDNRDDSVDSRFAAGGNGPTDGLGQVPLERVAGVPWLYNSWSRFGESAGH